MVDVLPPGPPSGDRIEPIGLEVQVRVRRRDTLGDLFGGAFSSMVPEAVLSNRLRIVVDALPARRPEPFSGVVGNLEIDATIDRDSVAANEAVTLVVRASGEGNLRAVPLPDEALVVDHAEGVWVWTEQGTRLLDSFAGLAVVNVGHGRRRSSRPSPSRRCASRTTRPRVSS